VVTRTDLKQIDSQSGTQAVFRSALNSRLDGFRPFEYDVIVGPVATGNDIKLMNSKDSLKELPKLIAEHENDQRGLQVVFCSDKAVSTLSLKGDIVVSVFEEVRKYG
jgi:hypothetical protein